jgi:hypothetical protein
MGREGLKKMNGLETIAAIVIIQGCIAVGILFEGFIFEQMSNVLQKRVLGSTYSRTYSTG